jgi:hypothetical protein
MRTTLVSALLLAAALVPAGRAAAQSRDEARLGDLRRLQDDLANLDARLAALDPDAPRSADLERRAEEIREETIYLKVKMRHHEQRGLPGTGVEEREVRELRRRIADLRDDIAAVTRRETGELRLPEGTEIVVRLEDPLASDTARREDRFEGTVDGPVGSAGATAIPAGARVRGVVRDVEPAHRPSKPGRLELELDALYLDEARIDLHADLVAVSDDARQGLGAREKAGLGAILGGVLGGMVGGKTGAITGIILGGGGAVAATKGGDVLLPTGTLLTFRLERPLTLPAR